MLTPTTSYSHSLNDSLILKSVSTTEDVEHLAAFNKVVHGGGVDTLTYNLIMHHPHTRPEHWLFIEDKTTGQVVSSLCLIPWTWRYENIKLKAGEMGFVGTLEGYRRRGLIRALVTRFKELLREGKYDLSHIQGIPYYYRQFGYEYAIPLEGGWRIEFHQIPDAAPTDTPRYSFRQATPDDLPVLMQLYDEAACDLSINSARDAETWRYLFEHNPGTETAGEIWLALDHTGQPVGYWYIVQHGFGEGLNISETSRLSSAAAVAALRQIKSLAAERNKPYIRLYPATNSTLVRSARAWGAHDLGRYAWQIHLPDVARLLHKLAPAMEQRIAASPFAGLTQNVCLNLYREAFELRFEGGILATVNSIGFKDGGKIRIPPLLFASLVLGYRSREELAQTYPDVSIWGQSQHLIDVLFPKVEAFIYTIY